MSLNLQNDGCAAVLALRNHPAWPAFMKALGELTRAKVNTAIEAAPELQASACGYARALRDLWIACESAATGAPQNTLKKPGVKE